MKKGFSRITVIVLALLMIFAFGACGDNPTGPVVNGTGDAIGGAADAMLKQKGVAITIDGTASLGDSIKNVKLGGDVKFVKNGDDYDVAVKPTTTVIVNGEAVTAPIMQMYKKDGIVFEPSMPNSNNGSPAVPEWQTYYMSGFEMPEGFDMSVVTEMLKGLDFGEFEKTPDGYRVSASEDYGKMFVALQDLLAIVDEKNVNDLISAEGSPITAEQLTEVINAMFDEEATVGTWIEEADKLLQNLNTSVKVELNKIFAAAGYSSANALYNEIKSQMPQEMWQYIPIPTRGQTVYDYVFDMEIMPGFTLKDMPANTVVAFIMSKFEGIGDSEAYAEGDNQEGDGEEVELPITWLRKVMLDLISEEAPTLDDLYDMAVSGISYQLSEMIIDNAKYILMISDEEAWNHLLDNYMLLGSESIAKMKFGDNKFEVKVDFNSDLTIKKIDIVVKNDIKFNVADDETESVNSDAESDTSDTDTADYKTLVYADVNVSLEFTYGSMSIELPEFGANDLVKPCIYADELDVTKLHANGFSVNVYEGKGFTFGDVKCDGKALDGLTYEDGKIKLTAAAVKTIKGIVEKDGYVSISLEVKKVGGDWVWTTLEFDIADMTKVENSTGSGNIGFSPMAA